jgi:glycerol-3-phosphate O-acyltransferase
MYKIMGIHFTTWAWLYSVLSFFMRIRIYPKSMTKECFLNNYLGKSIVYILPRMSIMDTIVLNKTLKNFEQKKISTEAMPKRFRQSALLAIKSGSLLFSNSHKDRFLSDFVHLVRNDPRSKNDKLVFIPVSIFWSRAPERNEKGFLLSSLFPDDGTGNALQKLFMLILHRGEVNISFGKTFYSPIIEFGLQNKNDPNFSMNSSSIENDFENARRMRRQFNIEFAKERTAAFGPTLYDNEKICQWILSTASTKKFLSLSENPIKAEEQIVKYIQEIGAKYNYVTIRALEKFFDFIWTKIFEGVRVRNFEHIERNAKDAQIIWMPSHRSHFDYLLLSYVLFKKGFVVPHIAAGINLNFWPIGSILRRGGAFFIRRSFSGNRIYAHTFSEYVNFLLQNSFPVEFFQEGGRSRIGKLLSPKVGMLNICVQSIIKRKAENTYIVPVYFGYDKVMEDDSYAKELKGAKKQKENAFQFLNGIRKVFTNYGSVDVSFGDPLKIGDIWHEYNTKIKKELPNDVPFEEILPISLKDLPDDYDTRDPQIQGFVKYISKRVNQKINCAATASGTSLLASCLLAQLSEALEYEELQYQTLLLNYIINSFAKITKWKLSTSHEADNILEYLTSFFNEFDQDIPLSETTMKMIISRTNLPAIHALTEQTFSMGERWKLMTKETTPEGNIRYRCSEEKEMNLWWYRGTIFHIIAPFGIIANVLLNSKDEDIYVQKLEFTISSIRRIWQDELFWDSKTSSELITKACLEIFQQLNFISIKEIENKPYIEVTKNSKKQQALEFLSLIIRPEVELYGIQMATALELVKSKGIFSRDELIQKTIATHSAAFLRTAAFQAPIFSKVFSQRAFDSLYKAGVFTPRENQKLSLNATALAGISGFFNVTLWVDFVS